MDLLSTVMLKPEQIVVRLLAAMLLGAVIGTEREYTHRPAGMRTHMLVALGACAVMITGQMIFCQYYPLGATPDPARLAAQVIAGVGFLGAGTILRDGTSIKGLTTAASVWTVACLGVAVGAGLYIIAVVGVVLMMVTLVLFERVQAKLLKHRDVSSTFSVTARSVTRVMARINELAGASEAVLTFMGMETREDGMELKFRIKFSGRHNQGRVHDFFAALGECEDVISVRTEKGGV
ncbi:MAG: MgtC/SapB family protein [Clostridia bacterium]|nr:MgtC/SapB family protein [Clostridia bacterium]